MSESLIFPNATVWHFVVTFLIVLFLVVAMAAGKQIVERIGGGLRRGRRRA